ncbi:MAG: hypothetical protein KME10_29225 [Plectolyngbya sp. WJT66-NPBG17]|jgi:FMN-dependent NADH-azoreductase|nr:hypothetical protein [Plectolyngbya sp. WJT66-NPBG17]
MSYILHIDSSPGIERSLSRMLSNQFVNANGLNTGLREQSLAEAQETLRQLAINW